MQSKIRNFCCALIVVVLGLFLTFQGLTARDSAVFADDELTDGIAHFVTIYDDGASLTVKTAAATVGEVLERVGITVDAADIVDPAVNTVVAGDSFKVNIHRARPALVIDGANRRYIMTASFDPKTIVREAGFIVYDGDEIELSTNDNFLESGVASTYRITRNGGRTFSIEETLPYPTETRYDYAMNKGEQRLEQAGEDGRKVSVYTAQFENNIEVSRELISETVTLEPVPEIVTIGAKQSIRPEQETCAGWLREIGVAEHDLEAALYIIYHESGCRVDAENPHSGAYGIPQALPGNKMASAGDDWRTNPLTQLRWMNDYVTKRYGGWTGALEFKQAKGWY